MPWQQWTEAGVKRSCKLGTGQFHRHLRSITRADRRLRVRGIPPKAPGSGTASPGVERRLLRSAPGDMQRRCPDEREREARELMPLVPASDRSEQAKRDSVAMKVPSRAVRGAVVLVSRPRP